MANLMWDTLLCFYLLNVALLSFGENLIILQRCSNNNPTIIALFGVTWSGWLEFEFGWRSGRMGVCIGLGEVCVGWESGWVGLKIGVVGDRSGWGLGFGWGLRGQYAPEWEAGCASWMDWWKDEINENLAISKGGLCNRQGFPMKYDFSVCWIGDFIGNRKGLTLQDYSESPRIFAGFSWMRAVRLRTLPTYWISEYILDTFWA